MYEAFFSLRARPFAATPDASCLFPAPPVQDVLDELMLRAASGEGIGVLSAPAGLGKTLLCRRLALELADQLTPVFLANANFATRRALLQAIHFELGQPYSGMDEQELRLSLISTLKEFIRAGRGLVLIVDEAHLLSDRLLEELRALATLSAGEQPLVRLVLAGQLSLEEKLIDPSLTALNQRVVAHVYLEPLTREESRDYIVYRVQWAGGDAQRLFAGDALDAIAGLAGGVPRCLNQLCDHALLLACAREMPVVTRDLVEVALSDLKQLPLMWNDMLSDRDQLESAETIDASPMLDDTELLEDVPAEGSWDGSFAGETRHADVVETTRGWCSAPRPASEAPAYEIGDDMADDVDRLDACRCEAVDDECFQLDATAAPARTESGFGGAVPLPGGSRSHVRMFQEEPVDDRYSALDVFAPRLARTFEDAAIPDEWKATVGASAEIPSVPPAPPVMPVSTEPIVAGIIEGEVEQVAPVIDVEEQISESLLDVCFDVQNSLGQWMETDSQPLEPATGNSTVDTPLEPDPFAALDQHGDYDIVQPEPRELAADAATDRAGDDARYVPAPNYRHVFSTLRRKLGKSLGRR